MSVLTKTMFYITICGLGVVAPVEVIDQLLHSYWHEIRLSSSQWHRNLTSFQLKSGGMYNFVFNHQCNYPKVCFNQSPDSKQKFAPDWQLCMTNSSCLVTPSFRQELFRRACQDFAHISHCRSGGRSGAPAAWCRVGTPGAGGIYSVPSGITTLTRWVLTSVSTS